VPAVVCTGSSSNLVHADCFNWISTVRSSPYFAKANPPPRLPRTFTSRRPVQLSWCSYTGVISCSGGHIISVLLARRGLAFNASDESSLGLLDGLQHIAMYSDALAGPVPKWLFNLASLKYVRLDNNRLTDTVPTELGALRGLATTWTSPIMTSSRALCRRSFWGTECAQPIELPK
jgi:hypothetical protein